MQITASASVGMVDRLGKRTGSNHSHCQALRNRNVTITTFYPELSFSLHLTRIWRKPETPKLGRSRFDFWTMRLRDCT